MKTFITGATGFIGGHVARKLRERGDEVTALARTAEKGKPLGDLGCEIVIGDLADTAAIAEGVAGCDAVIHAAAIYEIGIPKSQRPAMYDANVGGTERVLRAALEAEVPRVVYVSTIAAFGNTRGKVVDETYEHPGSGFTSYYEETKYLAHRVAKRFVEEEQLPCVILQPGGVYGPDDHSQLGNLIGQYVSGKLPLIPFPDLGLNLVHVEDVADGVLLGLDEGGIGEAYVLGGAITTNREMLQAAAKVAGKQRGTRAMPSIALKAIAPLGPAVGPLLGFPPNMRELVSSSDGVTFWAKHDKAISELGYSPRGLESTIRDTMAAEGHLGA
ncbi:MAG TPA: NAD-dependent epimerase/dehydratase family protein [Solirubrobacterales bacterium]|nr:NAD-dependent epimerase/dehydratase family protein [Solirubrobacterales bacterium]